MEIKKYWKIHWLFFRTSLSRDLSFRFSFFAAVFGAFCYITLNFFIVFFLTQKVNIVNWTQKEMWVMLGFYYIVFYSMFFFFYRSFSRLIRSIRDGSFDYSLLRPIDSQFIVSDLSGGVHNLLAIFFGIGTVIWAASQLHITFDLGRIFVAAITVILSILDIYSLVFLLITLNFRFGYLEEVVSIVLNFQDLARYPTDAFAQLPLYLLLVALPFSSLASVPSITLIKNPLPVPMVMIFILVSVSFILLVRHIWFRTLRGYTSGG